MRVVLQLLFLKITQNHFRNFLELLKKYFITSSGSNHYEDNNHNYCSLMFPWDTDWYYIQNNLWSMILTILCCFHDERDIYQSPYTVKEMLTSHCRFVYAGFVSAKNKIIHVLPRKHFNIFRYFEANSRKVLENLERCLLWEDSNRRFMNKSYYRIGPSKLPIQRV